ncbi:aspartate/glutamate racemase family protein [Alkalimarinus sediminis]|uniref:Aspartate/glutamate racemase family protein n=1 Tax=Alkalimarinus sediminis TaxID=1632866 RepID=A0A9E8HQ31_9ALTE|nr:aspartate/glutamate racemase family protein [Alkalimarinus sediminis]UZW74456.1 aspartate/glutamate racemase family protein [Alkalimarinus sediminis]
MKTIGLIGGMSWESTMGYYREINQGVKAALGGLHSAKIVLFSVDFDPIEKLQQQGEWHKSGEILANAARQVERAGADCILICTNTMHKVADQVASAVSIPLLHIADATGESLLKNSVKRVGLLGTGFTMEQEFYKGRLTEKYGLEVIIPNPADMKIVHEVIYQELCLGVINASSKTEYLRIINELQAAGAEAVILGCTEIGMLITSADAPIPLYDTTQIHGAKAVEFSLN